MYVYVLTGPLVYVYVLAGPYEQRPQEGPGVLLGRSRPHSLASGSLDQPKDGLA